MFRRDVYHENRSKSYTLLAAQTRERNIIYICIRKVTGARTAEISEGNDLLPRKLINGSQPYRFTLFLMDIY